MEISLDLSETIKFYEGIEKALAQSNVDQFLLKTAAPILRKDIDFQFNIAGDPTWTPLAPSTIKQKNRHGEPRFNRMGTAPVKLMQLGSMGGSNILIRSGDLRVSWTKEGSFMHVCRVVAGQLQLGSRDPVAVYHQSDRPRRTNRLTGKPKLPRRPVSIRQNVLDDIKDREKLMNKGHY